MYRDIQELWYAYISGVYFREDPMHEFVLVGKDSRVGLLIGWRNSRQPIGGRVAGSLLVGRHGFWHGVLLVTQSAEPVDYQYRP